MELALGLVRATLSARVRIRIKVRDRVRATLSARVRIKVRATSLV